MEERKFEVTPEEFAGHIHFLKDIAPVYKALEDILRTYAGPYNFPAAKFSQKYQEVLTEARRILGTALVSRALLKVKKEEPIILLAANYDRRT